MQVSSGVARGVHLAIDDTGSGCASLQHLTCLRPDDVELAITFVRDVHAEPARRAIARALVGLADDIGATLVAEGIETASELEALIRLGATHGQGYHLARPAPPRTHLPAAPRPPAPAPAPDPAPAPPRQRPAAGEVADGCTRPSR